MINPSTWGKLIKLVTGSSESTMKQLSNVYIISALATIGGLIQGFDVSSMSAIIGTDQVIFVFIFSIFTLPIHKIFALTWAVQIILQQP